MSDRLGWSSHVSRLRWRRPSRHRNPRSPSSTGQRLPDDVLEQDLQSSSSSSAQATNPVEPTSNTLQTQPTDAFHQDSAEATLISAQSSGQPTDLEQFRQKWKEEIAAAPGAVRSPEPRMSSTEQIIQIPERRMPSTEQVLQVSERESHRPTVTAQASPSRGLWDQALDRLRLENQALVTDYESALMEVSGVSASGNLNEQMQKVISSRLQKIESREWKVRLGRVDFRIREQMDRIVGFVLAIRDIGNSVAGLDPVHAGIPWAGVCVLLSVVVNDSVARNAARDGLEKLAIIVPRYEMVESLYFSQLYEGKFSAQLKDAIIKLYVNILSYQIEVARYLMRASFHKFARAILNTDDWTAKLHKVQESDKECKDILAVCDTAMAANAMGLLRDQLLRLNDRVNQRTAEILKSRTAVSWNSGPDIHPGHVAVLYGGSRARAGFYRISLAAIDNDRSFFITLRTRYAERQHPMRVALGWLIWFNVERIDFVKYQTTNPSKASYAATGEPPLQDLLPMDRRIRAWHHPDDLGVSEDQCLIEVRAVLKTTEQWGILIVEKFEVVKFSISMAIAVGLSLVVQMVTEEFGRPALGSLRASFVGMFGWVMLFGVLGHPAMIDDVRQIINRRRMFVFISCLVAGVLMDVLGSMMSTLVRRTLNSLLILALLAGLLYGM